MSRRSSRELALLSLFSLDINLIDIDDAILNAQILKCDYDDKMKNLDSEASAYVNYLVNGVSEHQIEIDKMIKETSKDWDVDRMAGVDRNIARLAIFEMFFASEILPPSIVINEAVEISKIYGNDESKKFINGILGALVRNK